MRRNSSYSLVLWSGMLMPYTIARYAGYCSGVRRAMEQALQAARDARGDFAVVSHGVIISRFLQSLTGTPRRPDYAEVIPLLWENGSFRTVKEIQTAGNL